jgi:hypothetical protein
MNTPWGISQEVETISRGIHWVSTASHGGLMVSASIAERVLTPKAIKVAFPGRCGGYVCFEEDCSYAIAFLEHPEWKRHLDRKALAEWECSVLEPDSHMGKAKAEAVPKLTAAVTKSDDAIREDMRAIVTSWNPEYFTNAPGQPIELGI